MKENQNSWMRTFFIILLICLAMLIVRYEGYGLGDMNDHLALTYHDANPEVLKNDWFVNSASEFNVRKGFGIVINSVNKIIGNYEISSIIVLFATMFFFALGFYKIMFLITKNYKLSLFSVIFPFIIYKDGIGGQAINLGNFILASRLSLPFIIFSLYLYLKRKYFLSFLLLGFMSLIHVSQSYLIYGILVGTLIIKKHESRNRWWSKKELKNKGVSVLKSLSFFIFFSLSLILLFRNSMNSVGISSDKIVYIFVRFRAPWHFSALEWPLSFWFWSAFFFVLFLIGYRYSKINKEYKNIFRLFVILIFICFILSFIFIDIIPTAFIVKLNLYRTYEFLNIIGFIFLSELFYTGIWKLDKKIKNLDKKKKKNKDFVSLLIALAALFILLNFLVIMVYWNPQIFGELLRLGILILMVLFLFLIFFTENKNTRVFLIIILAFMLLAYTFYSPLIGRHKEDEPTEEMYSFIKNKIPPDSVILIPPHMTTFRVGAERAVVIDFKTFPFSDEAMVGWYERILDITNSQDKEYEEGFGFVGGNGMEDLKEGYNSLTKKDVLNLKEKYGFSYAVFEKPKTLNLDVVYENSEFVIYKV